MSGNKLTRYACGHVGRTNEGYTLHPKAVAFIRVAEVRDQPVDTKAVSCPDCSK